MATTPRPRHGLDTGWPFHTLTNEIRTRIAILSATWNFTIQQPHSGRTALVSLSHPPTSVRVLLILSPRRIHLRVVRPRRHISNPKHAKIVLIRGEEPASGVFARSSPGFVIQFLLAWVCYARTNDRSHGLGATPKIGTRYLVPY